MEPRQWPKQRHATRDVARLMTFVRLMAPYAGETGFTEDICSAGGAFVTLSAVLGSGSLDSSS
jgi:hypothetical protein